jgi:hypothetical protein
MKVQNAIKSKWKFDSISSTIATTSVAKTAKRRRKPDSDKVKARKKEEKADKKAKNN